MRYKKNVKETLTKRNGNRMSVMSEKPKEERLKESLEIFRSMKSLGIPFDSPEVQELKQYMDAYVRDGICWTGTISFLRFGRIAEINLPRRADKQIEVTLRKPRVGG